MTTGQASQPRLEDCHTHHILQTSPNQLPSISHSGKSREQNSSETPEVVKAELSTLRVEIFLGMEFIPDL